MTQMARYYGTMRDIFEGSILTLCYVCKKCEEETWITGPKDSPSFPYEIECQHCAKKRKKNETTND